MYQNMTNGIISMATMATSNDSQPVQAWVSMLGAKKFMPKKPVMNERGKNKAVTTAIVFITLFMRLLMMDR